MPAPLPRHLHSRPRSEALVLARDLSVIDHLDRAMRPSVTMQSLADSSPALARFAAWLARGR